MCKIVYFLYLGRQFVRKHFLQIILVPVLYRLFIIPALELKHGTVFFKTFHFFFNVFLLLDKKLQSLGICAVTFGTPLNELTNILDFKTRLFKTLDNIERFKVTVTEFAYAGGTLDVRQKTLLVVMLMVNKEA